MEQILEELEDTAVLLRKTQTNLKKCSKQRLTKGYIETRLQLIEEYWKTFTSAHQQLLKCVPKDQRETIPYLENEEYYVFEDLYLCLKGDLKDMLISTTAHVSNEVANVINCSGTVEDNVRLPRINLPTFSGFYEDWPTFQDLYTCLVHKKSTLTKVQKLYYLKNSVTGEADTLLRHIQITEANYDRAWALLQERFGNKRIIVNSLLKKLFLQKKIPTQSAAHIKMLLDTTTQCIHSLNNLNISTDSWDPIIIFLVSQKLDPELHLDWEEYAYKDNLEEFPTWDNLSKFLHTKYRTLELVTPPSREKTTKSKDCTVYMSMDANLSKKIVCSMCKEYHKLCHCKEFTKMQPKERCEYVKSNNLCFNCLALGHAARRCRLNSSCQICHKCHHSLVHQNTQQDKSN